MAVELKQDTVRLLFRQFGSTGTSPEDSPFMTHHWLAQRVGQDEIDMLVAEGILTAYEETRSLLVGGDLEVMLFTHHYGGGLCYYTENDGLMPARREDILRYRLNTRCLMDLLYRLLGLPDHARPIVRIPGVLWQMGPVSVINARIPVWYCSALVPNYQQVSDVLKAFREPEKGVLLTGYTVGAPYRKLPGIQDVRVIDDLIDPWSPVTQLNTALLAGAFLGKDQDALEIPFFMPLCNSSIRIVATNKTYPLRQRQKVFFRYILDEGRDTDYVVSFSEALEKAGYQESYSSLKSLFPKRHDLLTILEKKGDVLRLLPSP